MLHCVQEYYAFVCVFFDFLANSAKLLTGRIKIINKPGFHLRIKLIREVDVAQNVVEQFQNFIPFVWTQNPFFLLVVARHAYYRHAVQINESPLSTLPLSDHAVGAWTP